MAKKITANARAQRVARGLALAATPPPTGRAHTCAEVRDAYRQTMPQLLALIHRYIAQPDEIPSLRDLLAAADVANKIAHGSTIRVELDSESAVQAVVAALIPHVPADRRDAAMHDVERAVREVAGASPD